MNEDSRLSWGISLLVFGFLFLLKQLGVFSDGVEDVIFNLKNLPLVFGVIFLITHKNKSIGLVLIVIGLLFYLKDILIWTRSLSELIWPILLIGAGIIILTSARTKKVNKSENSEIVPTEDKKDTHP